MALVCFFVFKLFFGWYSRLATYYTLPGYRCWTYACNVDCFSAVLKLSKPISNRNVKDHAWKWSIRALGHHISEILPYVGVAHHEAFGSLKSCDTNSPSGCESSMKLPFRGPVRRFWWRSIATSASSLWRPKIFSIHWLKYVDNLYKASIFPKPRTIRIFHAESLISPLMRGPTEPTDPRKPNKPTKPRRGVYGQSHGFPSGLGHFGIKSDDVTSNHDVHGESTNAFFGIVGFSTVVTKLNRNLKAYSICWEKRLVGSTFLSSNSLPRS